MSNESPEDLSSIWDKLSTNSKKLCIYLGPVTATSETKDLLKAMAKDIDLDPALDELRQFKILEQVTFMQELEEKVHGPSATPPEEGWTMKPGYVLTDGQREYLRAKDNLDRAEKLPEIKKQWSEPRYRLSSEFKNFVDSIFSK